MTSFKPSSLRRQADDALQNAAYPPKKLALIHAAAALGVSFVVTTLNFILTQQMAGTGGLSGLGTRSILTTIQSVLELVGTAALPFWELSFLFIALRWAKGESAGTDNLLQGFRRIPTALGLWLMEGLLYVVVFSGIVYVSVILFSMTSLGAPLMELLMPIMEQSTSVLEAMEQLTPEMTLSIGRATLPLYLLIGGLSLLLLTPLFYRFRFAMFSIMDGNSAFSAMVHSVRITHKNCLRLFWVDVSFWWYYLLQAVGLLLCYGDLLLPYLGISVPFSEDTGFFLFYILGTVFQLLLLWQFRSTVTTTYAKTYLTLWQKPPTARENNLP